MKRISRFTALLLAMMLLMTDALALTLDSLTQDELESLYSIEADEQTVTLDQGVLGEWMTITAFGEVTDRTGYSFVWYDGEGNVQTATADDPAALDVRVTMQEQKYSCVMTEDGAELNRRHFIIPAAQTTDMEAYVGFLSSYAWDNDAVQYDKELIYDYLIHVWNVTVGETTLGANAAAEWWLNWSDSDMHFDMMCTCVLSGAVEAEQCVLYPGTSQHAEGCEWAGEGEIIEPDIPQPPLYRGDPQGNQYVASAEYTLPTAGERAVILPEGGRAIINSAAADGAQWQVSDGAQWVDIAGENRATLVVTTAKLNAIFELTGVAELRYFSKDSQTVLASVSVTSEKIANGEYLDPAAEQFALFAVERAETDKHTIVINYLFSDGEIVTSPYTATIEKGGNFAATVPNPTVRGYKLAENNAVNVPSGFAYQAAQVDISVQNIQADMKFDVYYEPATVSYTVIHYAQNIDNDNYTEAARETMTGLTKSQVPEVALDSEHRTATNNTGFDPTGFFSLVYEKANIAADGSTIVEVYYDRKYYLLNFDLGGGYGVEPIYARYETPVGVVPDPVRAGYEFVGWSLDGKHAKLPQTVPAQNQQYKAIWQAEETSYTVVYWRADLDDGNAETPTTYSYWGQKSVNDSEIKSGDPLVPSEVGTTHTAESAALEEAGYFAYDAATTAAKNKNDRTIIVEGDGSTIVNVYYNRKEYTIWFIYTRKKGDTYYFPNSTGCGTYNNGHDWSASHGHTNISWGYSTEAVPVVNTPYANNTGSFVEGEHTYYYIYLSAEYGASLAQIWPAAPVSKTGGYDFGSWATQCGSPYREKYSKEHSNIVGAYPNMSEELIVDPANSIAQKMIAWWAKSNDYVSTHTYHIYFQALPGQENAEGVKLIDGIYYVPADEDVEFTCAHNGNTRVDPFEYIGYTCTNNDKSTQQNSKNYYHNEKCPLNIPETEEHEGCEYCQVFYYKRNTYTLSFFNYNEDSPAPDDEKLVFGDALAGYEPKTELANPVGLEHGAYEFAGWYTTPECYDGTEVKWNSTMPAGDVTLYAKWEPVTHDVLFYLDKEDMENDRELVNGELSKNVPHGTILSEKQVPSGATNGGLTFVGWFYEEDGVEKAIDFENMPITQDLKVYGKWSSNILKEYTVYFKIKGTDTEIADSITGSSLAGMTKTFDAKGSEDLKPEYREGYFPEVKSHSLTLSIDDANNTGANTFTFWYVQKDAVPYTVHYVAKDLTEGADPSQYQILEINGTKYYKLIDSVTDQDNKKAVVTETFKVIEGYMPDAYQKRLVVSSENGAANEIIFYYSVDVVNAYYKVSHWLEPLEGNIWSEYGTGTQAQGKINNTKLKAEDFDLSLDGYTFDVTKTECIYGGDEAGKKVVGDAAVTLPQEGLELRLYYVRNEYPYEIRHEELNTGVVLAPAESGAKKYGATVKGSTVEIPGYTYRQATPQEGQISIRIEENTTTAKLNVITYYYVENDATFEYVGVAPDGTTFTLANACGMLSEDAETIKVMSGTVRGATATANAPSSRFVGWFIDEACTVPAPAEWITENADGTVRILPQKTVKYTVNGVERDAYESAVLYAKFEWVVADLVITKTVADSAGGVAAPTDDVFTLTVELPKGEYDHNGTLGSSGKLIVAQDNQPVTLTIKAGERITIEDIVAGSAYKVEEINVPSYFRASPAVEGTIATENNTAAVTNTYLTGDLSITKQIVEQEGFAVPEGVAFTFNVTLTGPHLGNSIRVSIDGAEAQPTALTDNVLTFTLKDDQTAILKDLPAGTVYSVVETVPDNFTVQYDEHASGTMDDDGESTVVINHYPARYGELKVEKSGLKDNESAIVDVEITTNQTTVTYTFVLNNANPSATITNILVGSAYTVSERTGWTWLYSKTPQYANRSGHVGDVLTTCTITNHSYSDKWMHDESYVVNHFGNGEKSGVNN